MFSLILKLMALRPLLSMAIFGIPILTLLAIGLFAVAALKIIIFIVVPALLVFWLIRRSRRHS
jgi:hypothetical protein